MKAPTLTEILKILVIRLPLALGAILLMQAGRQPLFELKGFGSFDLPSVSSWAASASRWILFVVLGSLLLPRLSASRWFLAIAVGILASPLAGMVSDARELSGLSDDFKKEDLERLIVVHRGAYYLGAGLGAWIIDTLIAVGVGIQTAKAKKRVF